MPLGPLMVDLSGETATADELDFLRHPAVGAVLLFARNYRDKTQVRTLVAEIKALRTPALLVAVDQEGGPVQRFTQDFHKLPAVAHIGQLYDRNQAHGLAASEAAGQIMAAEVLQTGVDFSFAPVLDCSHPHSRVLSERAFHHDPAIICTLANAYISGMNRAGMAATGKHFPGHGGVSEDSHHELPVDSRALPELEKRDLAPFTHLAKRLGGIMTAHILFERIHAQPPAYSSFWLKQILRQNLGFDGVIFSDDLSMKGAGAKVDIREKCRAALTAGCDMALVCNDPNGARSAADYLAQNYAGNQRRLSSMRPAAAADTDAVTIAQIAERLSASLPESWS